MKHQYEDYIKWIDDELLFLDNCLDERGWESKTEKNYRASLLANKATLERHNPIRRYYIDPEASFDSAEEAIDWCGSELSAEEVPFDLVCKYCYELEIGDDEEKPYRDSLFPCPALLDVTNQLDEVMG